MCSVTILSGFLFLPGVIPARWRLPATPPHIPAGRNAVAHLGLPSAASPLVAAAGKSPSRRLVLRPCAPRELSRAAGSAGGEPRDDSGDAGDRCARSGRRASIEQAADGRAQDKIFSSLVCELWAAGGCIVSKGEGKADAKVVVSFWISSNVLEAA